MASRVYSETFHRTAAVGTHVFIVPYGKRAVVKKIECVSFQSAGSVLSVLIGPQYLVYWTATAPVARLSLDTFTVVYGGQSLTITISVSGMHTHVSGFLFDDPVGAEAEPAVELLSP